MSTCKEARQTKRTTKQADKARAERIRIAIETGRGFPYVRFRPKPLKAKWNGGKVRFYETPAELALFSLFRSLYSAGTEGRQFGEVLFEMFDGELQTVLSAIHTLKTFLENTNCPLIPESDGRYIWLEPNQTYQPYQPTGREGGAE